jgi:hypothetical protein
MLQRLQNLFFLSDSFLAFIFWSMDFLLVGLDERDGLTMVEQIGDGVMTVEQLERFTKFGLH